MPQATDTTDIQRLSPEKLVTGFSATPLWLYFVVALAIHAVLFGATSTRYIKDRWIDPQAALARKQAAEAEAQRKVEAERQAKIKARARPATQPAAAKPADAPPAGDKPRPPVVDRVNDKAPPDELPKGPDLKLPPP